MQKWHVRVAVCCSVLQCVAVSCSELQWVAVSCSVLQCVAVCCSVSCGVTWHIHTHTRPGRDMQMWHAHADTRLTAKTTGMNESCQTATRATTHYNALQLAPHHTTPQHTATHCNSRSKDDAYEWVEWYCLAVRVAVLCSVLWCNALQLAPQLTAKTMRMNE